MRPAAAAPACTLASASALRIRFWPSLIAGLVPLLNRRLPAKRDRSTSRSAAISTRSAAAISSSLNASCAPTEPWVSTRIAWPNALAACCSPSAAMKVWAIPVGQEVTATMRLPSFAVEAVADVAASSASAASGSSSTSPRLARTIRALPKRDASASPSPTSSSCVAAACAAGSAPVTPWSLRISIASSTPC
ncbi:hypothetical protein D3C73_1269370 [compost metagenome]